MPVTATPMSKPCVRVTEALNDVLRLHPGHRVRQIQNDDTTYYFILDVTDCKVYSYQQVKNTTMPTVEHKPRTPEIPQKKHVHKYITTLDGHIEIFIDYDVYRLLPDEEHRKLSKSFGLTNQNIWVNKIPPSTAIAVLYEIGYPWVDEVAMVSCVKVR
jgi:hypothetical protein